jgi:hypothetical protein
MRRDVVQLVRGAVPSVERDIASSWQGKTDTSFTYTLRYWTRDSEDLTLHQISGSFIDQPAVTEFWVVLPSCSSFACGPNGCSVHYLSLYFRTFRWLQVVGRVVPQPATSQNLQCAQLTPKTASVVPPKDGHLTPETCRGSRHNKVIVKVKAY